MKRATTVRLLCVCALAGLGGMGCAVADTGSFVRLQEEVVALKREVAAVKASAPSASAAVPGGSAESGDVSALQRSVADLTVATDQTRSDVLAATTRADEEKVALQKEIAGLHDRATEHGQAIQEMRGKLGRVDEIDRRVAALEEKVNRLAAGAPAPVPVPAAQDWKTPEDMYDHALGQIKGGDARKGREILSAFTTKYPGHRLLPNAYYWKGESFYAEKDYENAILAFQDVLDKYPAGDKAPDAMYKQGLSFLALKDRKNARIVLELLLSKYPKSPAAETARQKLAEMK